ncbi:MAG TPA: zf-HC2 domain-containing protein [Polyangiaceae bacterium]|nr:zf-HC2 domain-containing protein [Polyangiaceae bacterium]
MAVAKIHPEHLIDKLIAGTLSPAEELRLRTHLANCAPCRFEIAVLDGIGQEAGGDESPVSAPNPPPAQPLAARVVSRARVRRRAALLIAALVLGTGGALAALSGVVPVPTWARWPRGGASKSDSPASGAVKRPALAKSPSMVRTSPLAARVPDSSEPSASAVAVPEIASVGPRAEDEDAATSPRLGAPLASPPRRTARAPSLTGARVRAEAARAAPVAADSARPTDGAATLFAEANRARRNGNAARAVELYRTLETRFPNAPEAQLSRALLARLLLDDGNPSAALSGFDGYLAQDAPVLGEEALVGRARALEQLGERAAAVATWREILVRFPHSVHARLAASRLAALESR